MYARTHTIIMIEGRRKEEKRDKIVSLIDRARIG